MELIHTCYRITDPDRSVAFYEALGFEDRGAPPEEWDYLLLGRGGVELHLVADRPRSPAPRGHEHVLDGARDVWLRGPCRAGFAAETPRSRCRQRKLHELAVQHQWSVDPMHR